MLITCMEPVISYKINVPRYTYGFLPTCATQIPKRGDGHDNETGVRKLHGMFSHVDCH